MRAQAYRFYEGALLLGMLLRQLATRAFAHSREPGSAQTGSRALRVLMVSGSFPPMHCGVGDYTAQLADALRRRRDVELVVLTSVAEAPFTPPFVRRRVERWRAHGPDAFVDMVATFRPDVVHVQYPAQGYESWSAVPAISVLARRRSNAGVVQTWHEYPQPLSTPAGWALMVMGGEADQLVYVRPDYE